MKRSKVHAGPKRRGGFTLVEVMIAMAVMITGALGLLALQRAVTRGNYEARQISTASQIARTMLERIRTDQAGWVVGGPTSTWAPANMANTTYLRNTPAAGVDQWAYLPGLAGTEGFTFDHYGRDLARTGVGPLVEYCVQTRLEWVYVGQAIRSDVRVIWDRMGNSVAAPSIPTNGCPQIPNAANHHVLYASSVVRWMPQ